MEWEIIRFSEVAKLINGRAYLMPELLDSGKYRIVRVGNFTGKDEWFYSNMELDDDKYCSEGDLLYKWACTFGPEIWKGEKAIYHYHIWKIINDSSKIDKRFLFYYLKYYTPKWLSGTNGSTMVHITKTTMEKKKLYIPKDINLQQKIAAILSRYDDAIQNNNKRIKILEQMAQNLYKEWFVRFRFPGYQNCEFENGIPKGWRVEKLGEHCNVFTGKKDVNQTVENGKFAFFSCSPEIYKSNDYIYDGKAILVAGNGSYTGRTRFFEGKFDLYQRTYAITTNEENLIEYLYFIFKMDFETKYTGGTRGAAIPYIVLGDITKYKYLYSKEIVKKFISIIIPMMKKIETLQQQNQNLAKQRDLLLPRLMSGKLQV